MQVSVEKTGSLERRMTVQVPAERIDSEVTSRLQSMKGSIRLDGFRPGKVPLEVVEKKYGNLVRQEVVDQVIHSTLREALTQENLRPVGEPSITPGDAQPGQQLEYVATFEVFPEMGGGIDFGFRVNRPVVSINDADISAMLNNLREQRATSNVVERKSGKGDQVVIDFEGKVNGSPFSGNKGEQVPVVLGSGSMVPGFEDQLTGYSAGDETTVRITFPDNYPSDEVAGKEAEFTVRIHSVSEMVLPELDDEFARAFGIAEEGLEGLKNEVEKNMQRELDGLIAVSLKDQVFSGLLEKNPVDAPNQLVEREIAVLGAKQGGANTDPAQLRDSAERRVKLGVLVSEVVRQHGLQIDPDRVRRAIETVAASYENPDEVIQHYYGSQEMLAAVQSAVMEDQVVDWIIDNAGADVHDEQTTFSAMVEASRQPKG